MTTENRMTNNHAETPIKADVYRHPVSPTNVTMQGILDKIKGCTHTLMPDGRTTVCQLTLKNGYTVNGISACVHVSNYNQALGENYAYEDALNKIWQLEGYLLAEKLKVARDL